MNWPASAIRLASVSLSAVALLGLATACEEANDLGLELPGTSPVSTQFQDIKLPASTVRQQPVQTSRASHFLVGRVRDAAVGTTTARSFLNVQIGSSTDSLPSKFTETALDSVVLSLAFDQSHVYGTATKPLRFDLFQLQQPLGERQTYNSTSVVPVSSPLLTNFPGSLSATRKVRTRTLASSTTDTTTTVITTVVPDRVIRVRLLNATSAGIPSASSQTAALATSIFTAAQTDASFNQEKLDALVKGLALAPAAGFEDNVVGFYRTNETRITFYFRGIASGKTVKNRHSYNVLFGNNPGSQASDAKFFTQLSTDFSGTRLAPLSAPNTQVTPTTDFPYTYLQEGVGLATRVELQGIAALKSNTSQVINRAELRIPIRPYSNGLFPYATNVYLYEVDAQNQVLTRTLGATTYDRLVQGEGVIPGTSVRSAPTGVLYPAAATFPAGLEPQYYAVNITEYVQAYLRGEGATGLDGTLPSALLLSPILRNNLSLTLNRSLLDANNVTLRVYYSNLQ